MKTFLIRYSLLGVTHWQKIKADSKNQALDAFRKLYDHRSLVYSCEMV